MAHNVFAFTVFVIRSYHCSNVTYVGEWNNLLCPANLKLNESVRVPTCASLVLVAADDIVGFSGDFGSGVGWEDEEEKETEEPGEEAEEEEGETGEADDGGYIW